MEQTMAVQNYRDLLAWQLAMELAQEVYLITNQFPASERFGLVVQLRRSAVSVPSNIAEGQGRGEGLDFLRFLRVANGSRQEMETQMELAVRLGFVAEADVSKCLEISSRLARVLAGLRRSVRDRGRPQSER
jgi:four helix bundle protein